MSEKPVVLVVDDDRDARTLLRRMLTNQNLEVMEAEDGRTALKIIDNVKPDLVLLDIMMPVMNGKATLREIRKNYSDESLPVIMVSADAAPVTYYEMHVLGCQEYVVKPVQDSVLIEKVNAVLNIVLPSGRAIVHENSRNSIVLLLGKFGIHFDERFLMLVANMLSAYLIMSGSRSKLQKIPEEELSDVLMTTIDLEDCRKQLIDRVSRISDVGVRDIFDHYLRVARRECFRMAGDPDLLRKLESKC